MLITIFGFLAALTSTISLIPQIYKTYKTKSTRDISVLMLLNFVFSSICWVIYGAMIDAMSVVWCNVIMLGFSLILMVLKYCYEYK